MQEMEIHSSYNFELYEENATTELEYMKEPLASAARIMSEQSEALPEARIMDEGSTMRILELGRRNELAEDGRRRYHSEIENAVQHFQAQHHEAQETAEQFQVQRERLRMSQRCSRERERERGDVWTGDGRYIKEIGIQCRVGRCEL